MRYKDLLNTNDILHLLTNKLNLKLKQKGRSIFFLCPFHSDKNPSCSFEPNRKIFTCFTCGFKASDIFNFWVQYQKVDREEAITEIGQMGYFDLTILQEKKKQEQKEKNQIFYLLSLIDDIYRHNLLTPAGQEVLNYLYQERKMDATIIDRFGLGCSINNRQLNRLLLDQKNTDFSPKDLLDTNLVWITDQNQTCDFFPAHHLIIPLANVEGKIVAFAARKIREISAGEGKYKYLPSYQYYQKSALLYNYSVAKKSRAEECYLVEGFFDVISLSKLGVENCLALLGTNLSEEQIKLLLGLKKRIILFLDNDKAGQEATINVVVKLLEREIDCEVVKNDYSGDPDELCRQSEKEVILNILNRRENPYSFILKYYFFKLEVRDNPQRIGHFINEIAKIFSKFKPNIYDFLISKISSLTGWKKNEIEPHFIKWNLPAFNTRHCQIIYFRELMVEKEKKIVLLCAQERDFWLLTQEKKPFFSTQNHRTQYYDLYNYYISSTSHASYAKKYSTPEFSAYYDPNFIASPSQKSKIINISCQELDNVKWFLLNYE